jgi:hypothetical protein
MKHPIQPLSSVSGVIRFKENAIVKFLLDNGPNDMNTLARMSFSIEDRVQFAQLIGYSLSGFGELSYVPDADWEAAAVLVDNPELGSQEARIQYLLQALEYLRNEMRAPIARLYGVRPDDLKRG